MSSDLPNARVDGSISKPMISMAVTLSAFASPFSAKATGQQICLFNAIMVLMVEWWKP